METYSSSNAVAQGPEERVKLNKLKTNAANYIPITITRPKKNIKKKSKKKKQQQKKKNEDFCANELAVAPVNKEGKKLKLKSML